MLKGQLLDGRYKIIEIIGGGGMANVYLATDTILGREVAIKVLRLEYANDEEFIARFDREAQAATSLSHPNIVNIYDVGEQDHILYMVMEYVQGPTLKEYIQKHGPIEVEEALRIMKQITSAIAHAHAHDLVHRDIKPQNILIDPNGQVKVTDFGIAIALSATALTQTNSILGSVHYLSPEQARGGLATKISDIYSLGIVFFELLTGRLPFSGESPVSIALKHLQNDTPSVRNYNQQVPQSVENIVLKSTAKDPFHRYQTVYEMEVALDSALDPSIINEEKYTPPVEAGEETKVIPIITDSQLPSDFNEDTIVQREQSDTKVYDANKKEEKPKKKRWKKWLIGSLIFVAILIIAAVVLANIFKPKEVTIPDLEEWEYEEAVEELSKLKLKEEKELIFSEEIEEGLVVKTAPTAGRTVKENSTITVFVSGGKEKIAFEDYVGQEFNQVKKLLDNLGYKDVIAYPKHSEKPEGEIISQVQPEAETEVVPSETQVIFEVSSGPELISLNNLKGMTEEEVSDYLKSEGLLMNKKSETSDTVPAGQVIRQDPATGTSLKKGATVDVYLSIGREKKPPVQHQVTFSVPYTGDTGSNEAEDSNDDNNDNEDENEDKNKSEDLIEQTITIHIEDMNNKITEVYQEDKITADKEYTITLTIEENQVGQYKVMRDDQLVIDKTIPYKEGG